MEFVSTKLRKRRLEWLGHLVWMPNYRIPQMCSFGWLPQTCPFHGPKKRWQEMIYHHCMGINDDMVSGMIRLRTRYVGGIQGTCDQLEYQQTRRDSSVLCRRSFKRASQIEFYQYWVNLVLHSAPLVNGGLGVKESWQSTCKCVIDHVGRTSNPTGSDLHSLSKRL